MRALACRKCGGYGIILSGFVAWNPATNSFEYDSTETKNEMDVANNFAWCEECRHGDDGLAEWREIDND
jgi:hypothetical protein